MSALDVDERCPSCGGAAGNNYFDRSLCPCDDAMHTRCVECGYALDGCTFEPDADVLARTAGAEGAEER